MATRRARRAAQKDGTGWPDEVFEALKALDVRQVAYVPDAGHARLIELCRRDNAIRSVSGTKQPAGRARKCPSFSPLHEPAGSRPGSRRIAAPPMHCIRPVGSRPAFPVKQAAGPSKGGRRIQTAFPWRKCGIQKGEGVLPFVACPQSQGALRQARNCGLRGRDFPPSRRTTAKSATPVARRRARRAAPNITSAGGRQRGLRSSPFLVEGAKKRCRCSSG